MVLVALYFGIDPSTVLNMGKGLSQSTSQESEAIPEDDEMGQFMAKVLGSTEDTWGKVFKSAGYDYPAPKLVLFRGQTQYGMWYRTSCDGAFLLPR